MQPSSHVLEFLRDDVLTVAEEGEHPSVGLLRRLKWEFSFFSIMPNAVQGSGQGELELFDTLIAEAKHSEDEDDKLEDEDAEDEEREEVDDEENVRTHERIQACTSRNQAQREAEVDLATSKWCTAAIGALRIRPSANSA
jgi:hypothetical protein